MNTFNTTLNGMEVEGKDVPIFKALLQLMEEQATVADFKGSPNKTAELKG